MLVVNDPKEVPNGQAYCISDDSPVDNFLFLKSLVLARGKRFPSLTIPYQIPYAFSTIWEMVFRFCESIGTSIDVPLTRAEIVKVSRTHYFSMEKAKKELGYKPEFDSTEGGARLALYYSKWNDDNYFDYASWYYYLLIPLGMWLTYRIAFINHHENYQLIFGYSYLEWLAFTIFRKQIVIQWVFYLAVLAHLIEGSIAYYIATSSFKNMKYIWFFQTLLLGYPSLSLALARTNRNGDEQVIIS
jgi:hypothetical protein